MRKPPTEPITTLCQLLLAKQLGQVIHHNRETYYLLNNTLFSSTTSDIRQDHVVADKIGITNIYVTFDRIMKMSVEELKDEIARVEAHNA